MQGHQPCKATSRATAGRLRSVKTRESFLTRGTVILRWFGQVAVASLMIAACGSPSGSAPTSTSGPFGSTTAADTTVGTVQPSSASQPTNPPISSSTTSALTTTTTKPTTTTTTSTAQTITGSVVSFGYNPNPITINVGDTIRWTNNSGIPHTVTSSGNWDSGSLTSGARFSEVFDSPGTFNYFCTIHGAGVMSATVVVNP